MRVCCEIIDGADHIACTIGNLGDLFLDCAIIYDSEYTAESVIPIKFCPFCGYHKEEIKE